MGSVEQGVVRRIHLDWCALMTPLELSLFLRRGTMLKAVLPDIPAQKRHFLVVSNADPRKDDQVYLVLVTSKRESSDRIIRRLNESPETLVTIPNMPSFDGQTEVSYVNCNQVFPKTFKELIEMFNRERTTPCKDMPAPIMDMIERGLLISNQISPAVKQAVRTESEVLI